MLDPGVGGPGKSCDLPGPLRTVRAVPSRTETVDGRAARRQMLEPYAGQMLLVALFSLRQLHPTKYSPPVQLGHAAPDPQGGARAVDDAFPDLRASAPIYI